MDFYGLIISSIIVLVLLMYLSKQKNKSQLHRLFIIDVFLAFFWDIGILMQNLICRKSNVNPYIFECFVYIFACQLPVFLYFTSLVFTNTKVKFKRFHLLLFVIPILSLIILWTNDFHHLFYVHYSINLNETKFGIYDTVYSTYTYLLLTLTLMNFLKYSIKNAGFFSKQSIFIIIGTLIPIIINILGTFSIIQINVYITPICFSFAILCYAIAIFKFDFLKIAPIAMQRIVDRMSDSFLVINEENIITDFNETFLKTFNLSSSDIRNANFVEVIDRYHVSEINASFVTSILKKTKATEEIILVKKELNIKDMYFNIEASGIFSKNSFLGTLVLFKNVTTHVKDKKIIENNQNMLMEKERLASLGQMIGGIAHNLKTPIMSIAGATEGLTDLTKEYDISIGDPTVTEEDHHAIVKDMNEWIEKIKSHISYMSDVITAVKGQAVAFSEDSADTFTVAELLKHVDVLMKHELKNALINLNTSLLVSPSLSINGNINSLVQVINNIISNAIQAYHGQTNKNIDFIISMKENNIIFTIQDYACGIPKKVQNKLFKEMITTKGKNGTGLGLFMSFSNIRAHFNGNMTFESEEGKGTKFYITIPLN